LLEVTKGNRETVLSYVDDVVLVTTARTFRKAHKVLDQMMGRWGCFDWVTRHKLRLKMSKSVVMELSWLKMVAHPLLKLRGVIIKVQQEHKFLES